jgi:hypothetical protein
MLDISEAIVKIRKVGSGSVRSVPMTGESPLSGKYQIEILESGSWVAIAGGMSRKMCEDVVSQALNRVILG